MVWFGCQGRLCLTVELAFSVIIWSQPLKSIVLLTKAEILFRFWMVPALTQYNK